MTEWQQVESFYLAPWASFSSRSLGREIAEPADPLRTVWQHDRDRITHSKAFRRMKHKTQVFVNPHDDHFRTRLTHTLEVTQIARTIARALHLNEDLTEAIGLGHDLGHTPFGHAGERALATVQPGFTHNQQSIRVATVLENEGRGLNLTRETLDGILHHSGPVLPATLEGQVVRICDRVAYLNHDIDDAVSSGYLKADLLPGRTLALGKTKSLRIDAMVNDIVAESKGKPVVQMSETCAATMKELRAFMFEQVYYHPAKLVEEERMAGLLVRFFQYYRAHPEELPEEYRVAPYEISVCDYIAGMTDTFALEQYEILKDRL